MNNSFFNPEDKLSERRREEREQHYPKEIIQIVPIQEKRAKGFGDDLKNGQNGQFDFGDDLTKRT